MPTLDPIPLPEVVRAARASRPGLLRLVGDTPLVPLDRVNPNPKVKLYGKLERNNPGGSIKDRIALNMIEAAEREGVLTPGKTIIEATSGNTGIGLAMCAAVKGYRIVLVLSEAASVERRKILAALGAEFVLTPADQGTDGAIEYAYTTAQEEPDRYFLPDQYNNPNNPLAHYYSTGIEIWQQTRGRITHFVAAMGTSGTIMGTGRRLRELNPGIRLVCVEPHLGHRIQGLKNLKEAYVPGIFDYAGLDEKRNVDDDTAFEMSRRLAREEGLVVGMSAGAAVAGAVEVARELTDGGVVVTILPDGGERYLSTPLFQVTETVPPPTHLAFLNTLTRRVEPFQPLEPGKVRMYACGPTAHALPHLGLMRRVVFTDLVHRALRFAGYEVEFVMNITDMDDKTLAAAEAQGLPLRELTDRHIEEFHRDRETLGVLPATTYARASDYVDAMIDTTRRLVDKGAAYELHRSVYFSIARFPHYGRLSGADLSKIKVGATVDLDRYDKDNPRDFTLLKRSTLGEIKRGAAYATPWGKVRPGWHVECAAIAMEHLGDRYDLHLGGTDLVFPHHENEIAVCATLTGHQPAQTWLHSEVVMGPDGKKMSHSQGNATSVRDLLEAGFSGREIRFLLLSKNYRQPLRYRVEAMEEARATLGRLDTLVHRLRAVSQDGAHDETAQALADLRKGFRDAIFQDLNVSAAIAEIFGFVRWANRQLDVGRLGRADAEQILATFDELDQVLGLGFPELSSVGQDIQALVAEREEARAAGDFDRADAIRERLAELGVTVADTATGPRVQSR